MYLACIAICCRSLCPPSLCRQLVQTAEFRPCVASRTRVSQSQELGHLIPAKIARWPHQPEELLASDQVLGRWLFFRRRWIQQWRNVSEIWIHEIFQRLDCRPICQFLFSDIFTISPLVFLWDILFVCNIFFVCNLLYLCNILFLCNTSTLKLK